MKKIFTLLVVMMMGICGWAQEVTFDFDNDYQALFPTLAGVSSNDSHDGDFTEATTTTVDGVSVTVSAAVEGNKNANRIWEKSPRLRMYSGTLTITAPEGKNVTNLAITQGKWAANNSANEGTLSSTSWEGNTHELVITIAGNTQFKSIVVTVAGGDVDNRKATTIEFAEGYETRATCGKDESIKLPSAMVMAGEEELDDRDVTWSLSSEDLAQLDGKNIKIFNGVQGQVTVKAEFAGDSEYKPSSKSYTLTVYKGYMLFASLYADVTSTNEKWDNGGEYASYWFVNEQFESVPNTVVYANGKYIYLTDGTNNLLFYGDNTKNLKQGDVISGDLGNGQLGAIWGKLYRYNKLPEFSFTDMDVKVESEGAAVSPKTITIGQLGENVNAYVKIEDAEFVSASNKNLTFKVGETELAVYNQFSIDTEALEAGAKYTIIGMGSVYKENYQLYPISFTSGSSNITTVKADAANNVIFNLQGQRVNSTAKGLYIINGKKVVK